MALSANFTSSAPIGTIALRFVSIYVPLLAVTGGMATALYWTQDRAERAAVEINQRDHVAFQSEIILGDFKSIVSDLRILAEGQNLKAFLDNPRPSKRDALCEEYQLFVASKRLYDQVRLIDALGMEIVRVNLADDRGVVVPRAQLQSKRERYYFMDSFRLDRGDVFVSPFDLNVEGGQVEEPLKPTIRFGTPVYDSAGRKRGIVVLNYLGMKLIDKLRRAEVNSSGKTMLSRGDGYWLKGPKPEQEWGFMYADRGDQTLAADFPAAWPRIASEESGQFQGNEGLFTFRTIRPSAAAKVAQVGGSNTTAAATIAGESAYVWKIVSHIAPDRLAARSQRLRAGLLRMMAALSLVLAGVSWLWARARIQQRHAHERLMQAERLAAIGEAMAGLAHESRNALQRSKAGLELLARRVADRREALDLVAEVGRAQDQLYQLYEEVQGYAAPPKLRRRQVDLRDLIRKAWDDLRPQLDGSGARLQIEPSQVDWRCVADPHALVQVLRNILENALAAAAAPTAVRVKASDTYLDGRPAVRLSICDNGPGLTPHVRAHMFEPFFTTKVRGTGLGLAISKRIVEAHGGRITLGETAGRGAELVITLLRRNP